MGSMWGIVGDFGRVWEMRSYAHCRMTTTVRDGEISGVIGRYREVEPRRSGAERNLSRASSKRWSVTLSPFRKPLHES